MRRILPEVSGAYLGKFPGKKKKLILTDKFNSSQKKDHSKIFSANTRTRLGYIRVT